VLELAAILFADLLVFVLAVSALGDLALCEVDNF
jgi:hypothetical protein